MSTSSQTGTGTGADVRTAHPVQAEPGIVSRQSYADGSAAVRIDLGTSSERITDSIALQTRGTAVLSRVDLDERLGVLTLTFTRPA